MTKECDDSDFVCNIELQESWVSLCDAVENVILLPFIAMQMSMVVFLLLHGRKEKAFRQAFYVFFVAVRFVDCALVVVRRVKYYNTNHISNRWYVSYIVSLQYVTDAIIPCGATAQPLFHLTIAANRFTAFAFPLRQSELWRPRVLAALAFIIAVASAMTAASGHIWFGVIQASRCRVGTMPEDDPFRFCENHEADFTDPQTIAQATNPLTNVVATMIFGICCTASLALNLCTIVIIVILRRGRALKKMGPELRLFVHSLVMFIVQAISVSQLLLQCWDQVVYTTSEWGFFAWMFPDGHITTSAELFFGVVSNDELYEENPDLDLSCRADSTGCGLLYGVLSGRQVVVGALTVGDLTQHVFALSGSLFLLVMSGLVRSAYVEFYFKRFLRRHKVNIIHVTPTNSGANV